MAAKRSAPKRRRRRRSSSRRHTTARRRRTSSGGRGGGLLGFVNKDLLLSGAVAMGGFVGSTWLTGKITSWYQKNNPTKTLSPYIAPAIMAAVGIAGGALLRKKSPALARNMAIGSLAASGGVMLNLLMANARASGAAGVHGYGELGDAISFALPDGSVVDGYALDGGTAIDGDGNVYQLEEAAA